MNYDFCITGTVFFALLCLLNQPYVDRVARYVKERHPTVPIVYFANGGSCYLHSQLDLPVDGLSIDWRISMARAREVAGPKMVLAGNVDPMVLYGSENNIRASVAHCIDQAKGKHVLNLGHGVEKDTPESSVAAFVDAAKKIKLR